MPIYEYRATIPGKCTLCKAVFEFRQNISDDPLMKCPKCGREVQRLISRSYVAVIDPLTQPETFKTYTEEQADSLGLEGGFAGDQIWE